jgi:hypothetical protein
MDIVVTVPKTFTHPAAPGKIGLQAWLAEGDAPGSEWSGQEWAFSAGPSMPDIKPGERVYVVCEGRLIGYAPLVRIDRDGWRILLIRRGGAVACSIKKPITGFRGWQYRFWERGDEFPIDL